MEKSEILLVEAETRACTDAGLLPRYWALLSPQEQARCARYVFDKDKHAYLISRALVRTTLARVVGCKPAEVPFTPGPNGKPQVDQRGGDGARIEFNLSHCEGMAVVCVATSAAVGVDVECTSRPAPLDVARRVFSPEEFLALTTGTLAQREDRFWALWTLKEAYVKATGEGLLMEAMTRMAFDIEHDGVIACRQGPFEEDGALWFGQWRPSPDHIGAVCVRAREAEVPSVCWEQAVPLVDTHTVQRAFVRASAPRSAPVNFSALRAAR